MEITVESLAKEVGGDVVAGDGGLVLRGFASLDEAGPDQLSFFGNSKYAPQLAKTRAAAVLISSDDIDVPEGTALIRVDNAVLAFDRVVRQFAVSSPPFSPGIATGALVGREYRLDPEKVSIQPGAVIRDGAAIGNGTRIGSGSVIGERVRIGEDCEIGANVTIREGCVIGDGVILQPGVVIGADGFGFEFIKGQHVKIEQLGIVRIENDVEIGANTTIDRARFGETVIGEGTKIDNLVQIAHNVRVGKHCIIVAQTGISGSARVGDYCVIAAQSGVAGHLEIAERVTLGGRSGVISSITESGGTYFGYPAKPLKEDRRTAMRLKQLERLVQRVKELESEVLELESRESSVEAREPSPEERESSAEEPG